MSAYRDAYRDGWDDAKRDSEERERQLHAAASESLAERDARIRAEVVAAVEAVCEQWTAAFADTFGHAGYVGIPHLRAALADPQAALAADRARVRRETLVELQERAELAQFPVPGHVALRKDNGYVSMTTLRLIFRELLAAAVSDAATEGGDA